MIRKRCEKCGKVSRVKPRETRCKQVQGALTFAGSVYCWGRLTRVALLPKGPAPASTDRLTKKLAKAHADFEDALTRLKRATTSVSKFQRRIKSIERAIELRDHPELKKPKREKPRTRAISLPVEADDNAGSN